MARLSDPDQLAVNTVRMLVVDAVQKASPGIPARRWRGAAGLYPVAARPALRPGGARLAQPRPLRAVERPRLDAALQPAPPAGVKAVEPSTRGSASSPSRWRTSSTFRQLGSQCPGHPEYRLTSGVETTTGPLGQGVRHQRRHGDRAALAGRDYNRPGFDLFDYDVYALCGDGDMMEGVASEAASMAGHSSSANLCWIYDSNHMTIEGHTDLAFTEDVAARFLAYGWNVQRVTDANDLGAARARPIARFRRTQDRPTLIVVDSHIGYGAPHKQDTPEAHGEPLGEEEIRLTKQFYGWPEDAKFLVPDGVREHFAQRLGARGAKLQREWQAMFERYRASYPDLAEQIDCMQRRELPAGWETTCRCSRRREGHCDARRVRQGAERDRAKLSLADRRRGRSRPVDQDAADVRRAGDFQAGDAGTGGRNMHFGIREHAMGAVVQRHGADQAARLRLRLPDLHRLHARGAIRLAALMELPVIYVFTHDSIGVGEDGPTHQPIEQLVVAARDSRHDRAPPGRCQRSGRGLARRSCS